jgi:hypothetical protein
MTATFTDYCDVCKTQTARCQYYPAGRSRQHAKCLACDRADPRNAAGLQSTDPRYCNECDRNHRLAPSH